MLRFFAIFPALVAIVVVAAVSLYDLADQTHWLFFVGFVLAMGMSHMGAERYRCREEEARQKQEKGRH